MATSITPSDKARDEAKPNVNPCTSDATSTACAEVARRCRAGTNPVLDEEPISIEAITPYPSAIFPSMGLHATVSGIAAARVEAYGFADALSGTPPFSETGRDLPFFGKISRAKALQREIVDFETTADDPRHSTHLGAAVRHSGKVLSNLQPDTQTLISSSDNWSYDVEYAESHERTEDLTRTGAEPLGGLSNLVILDIAPHDTKPNSIAGEFASESRTATIKVPQRVVAKSALLQMLSGDPLVSNVRTVARRKSFPGASRATYKTSGGITR